MHGICKYNLKEFLSAEIMSQFKNLDHPALLDALAQYTSRYTKMIAEGAPKEDSVACGEIIQLILAEIESRKKSQQDSRVNNPDITLPHE